MKGRSLSSLPSVTPETGEPVSVTPVTLAVLSASRRKRNFRLSLILFS